MSEPTAPETASQGAPRVRALPRWVLIATAILLAFLVGFGWQCARAERLESALEETRRALTLARLEATLGAATIEAQAGNYETARQGASDFFTGLRDAMSQVPDQVRGELDGLLARRDATITVLARGNPASASALAKLFVHYRAVIGRAKPGRPAGPSEP